MSQLGVTHDEALKARYSALHGYYIAVFVAALSDTGALCSLGFFD